MARDHSSFKTWSPSIYKHFITNKSYAGAKLVCSRKSARQTPDWRHPGRTDRSARPAGKRWLIFCTVAHYPGAVHVSKIALPSKSPGRRRRSAHSCRNPLRIAISFSGSSRLQMDLITRDGLVAAMHAWVLEKQKALGQILVDQGGMSPDEHALLEALVAKHVERHWGDAAQSLASLSPVNRIKHDLESIADPGLEVSLRG